MQHLIEYARRRGLSRLEGGVLRENQGMIRFVTSLGFEVHENLEEPEQVKTVLDLTRPGARRA